MVGPIHKRFCRKQAITHYREKLRKAFGICDPELEGLNGVELIDYHVAKRILKQIRMKK